MSALSEPHAAPSGAPVQPDPDVLGLLGRLLPAWLARQGTLLAVKDLGSGAYLHVCEAMAQWLQCDASALRAQGDAALAQPWPAPLRAAEQHALQLPPDTPLLSEHRFEWRGALHEFSVWREVRLLPGGRRVLCSLWSNLAPQRREQQRQQELLQQVEQLQRQLNEQLCSTGSDGVPLDRSTGLHLRGFFDEQLQRAVAAAHAEHRELALVWVALDVPQAGTAQPAWDDAARASVQATLARLLRANTRATDSTCHLGGQRFAVLMANVGMPVAYGRMEQLRRECAAQIVVCGGKELRFSVSMGVASCPHIAHDAVELQAACEAALAQAQQRGGDQTALARVPFTPPR